MNTNYRFYNVMICGLLLLAACSGKTGDQNTKESGVVSDTKPEIKEVTVPVENKYGFLFTEGKLNDTLPVKIFLTMGTSGVSLPDSLKRLVGDSVSVNAGKFSSRAKVNTEPIQPDFSKYLGSNTIKQDWQSFCNGKIIEISYRNRTLKEITDPAVLQTFHPVVMTPDRKGDSPAKWSVPLHIRQQFNSAEGEFEMNHDTEFILNIGFNGSLAVSEKTYVDKWGFARDTTKIKPEGATQFSQVQEASLGNLPVRDASIQIISRDVNEIGNMFLENYTIAIDFKNNTLYVKPADATAATAR